MNWDLIAGGIWDDVVEIRRGEKTRYCLFKLSDLGLWKAFPRFLLKRGFEIKIQLTTDFALVNSNPSPEEEGKSNLKLLQDIPVVAGTKWRLRDGICLTTIVKPDDKHITQMLETVMQSSITLPYYTWVLSNS